MEAAYVRAPFQFQIRDVELRSLDDEEVLVDVRACGVCGGDLEEASSGAPEWRPLGHEVAGVVAAVGRGVRDFGVGCKVILARGAFGRFPPAPRVGGSPPETGGRGARPEDPRGFSERVIVSREYLVPFEGISFVAAAVAQTVGVAASLVRAAEIALNDDVLVLGTGSVGLVAVRLARLRGARRIYAALRSGARRREELAREMGADVIVHPDEVDLHDHEFSRGGVDRVLVTAPPRVIPDALAVARPGGIVAFASVEPGDPASVCFDPNDFLARGLQLRACRFPLPSDYTTCIELIQSGAVNAERLVSHTFQLAEIPQAFRIMRDDRPNRVKLVMARD